MDERRARTALGKELEPPQLRRFFDGALSAVERCAPVLDALNVFPVPDGDTGKNMLLTLRSAANALAQCSQEHCGAMLENLAHGALMGARGNSGVIMAQILRGLTEVLRKEERITGPLWARGWREATKAAYRAVANPKEGTILTVVRAIAEASERAAHEGQELQQLLPRAVEAAHVAVWETPQLLEILRQAGVVDAGGLGLALWLQGGVAELLGTAPPDPATLPLPPETFHAVAASVEFPGYCTEFLIQGTNLDQQAIREHIAGWGDSILVVGDTQAVRVHIHTDDPERVLAYGASLGTVLETKVENMEEQRRARLAMAEGPVEIALAAVVAGHGMEEVYRSLGVHVLVPGGETMNPSVTELLAALDQAPADRVLLIANNKNIVPAAEQAAAQSTKQVTVVPTRTMVEGIAAVLAFSAEEELAANAQAMREAAERVRTVAVTRAIRSVRWGDVRAEQGQYIAVSGDEVLAAGDELVATAEAAVAPLVAEAEIVTIYVGEGAGEQDAEALAQRLHAWHAGLSIEVVHGGQPHYPFLIGIE